MANKRMIASDIWRDDFVCSLDYFKRLLWVGMIVTCADDQGRIQDRAGFIASDVFPGEMLSHGDIENALKEFEDQGKIVRYTAGKVKLVQIVNWWSYQSPQWVMPSKYPAPDGWVDRVKMHSKDNKVVMLNWNETGGFQNNLHPVPTSDLPCLPTAIDDGDGERRVEESRGEDALPNGNNSPISPEQLKAFQMALGELERSVSRADYDAWIKPIELVSAQGDTFTLRAINQFGADIVKTRYGPPIAKTIQGYLGRSVDLQIVI